MKLFIQIPCFNEEATLAKVVSDLPKEIKGIDEIYTLVIDDGSTDNTVEVAKKIGVNYILKNHRNFGLSKSFSRGIDVCVCLGADIIVNTDGDNQYSGKDIIKLVQPILNKKADLVVGCRDIENHVEFSISKKIFQKVGSNVVRLLSNTTIPDTTSGFRAFSRRTAMQNVVTNEFSYTIEMLIQAGRTGLKVEWIPINTNLMSRPSRLFKSNFHFILTQLKVMFFVYLLYCPMRLFGRISLLFLVIAIMASVRLVYYLYFIGGDLHKFKEGNGLLILLCLLLSIMFIIAGMLGSVLSGLRQLIEETRFNFKNVFSEQLQTVYKDDIIINRE